MTNKNPSTTKAGPGRFHKDGHQKATPVRRATAPIGSGPQFLKQVRNEAKQHRNALKEAMGNRQFRKMLKESRRAAKHGTPA